MVCTLAGLLESEHLSADDVGEETDLLRCTESSKLPVNVNVSKRRKAKGDGYSGAVMATKAGLHLNLFVLLVFGWAQSGYR